MDNDERSLFERMDSVEGKIDSQNSKVDELNETTKEVLRLLTEAQKNHKNGTVSQKQNDKRAALNGFIRKSQKEYFWFGTRSQFVKAKTLFCLNMVLLTFVGVLATVFTSIAIGIYSTFSLFENIWLIFSIIMTTYGFDWKRRISDIDYKNHSCNKFVQDRDGIWRVSSYKKTFLWFRRISDVCCIANIIMMWCINKGNTSIVATIFEVLMLVLTLLSIFSYSNLTSMYGNIILFTNKNRAGETITIVFDAISKKLMSYDEFEKKFNKILF